MNRPVHSRALHLFACLTAMGTFVLLIAGGMVTSTGSGLSVPDWPLSYGQLFPPMVGGIFYEHGHRMIAGVVGMLMAVLAVWLQLREPRGWVRGLGWIALGAVVVQAVLGGITVLYLLPLGVSVAHATLGQVFFCLTVTLALVTSRWWKTTARRTDPSDGWSLTTLGILATGIVFAQLVLGALMRHLGAGLAIPDFPLSFGRLVPPLTSLPVAVNFVHRINALIVVLAASYVLLRVLGRYRSRRALLWPGVTLAGLAAAQFLLGALTVWTGKAVIPATAHVAGGALVLATSLLLTLSAARCLRAVRRAAPFHAPARRTASTAP